MRVTFVTLTSQCGHNLRGPPTCPAAPALAGARPLCPLRVFPGVERTPGFSELKGEKEGKQDLGEPLGLGPGACGPPR